MEYLSNSTNPEIVWKVFTDQEYLDAVDLTENGGSLLDFEGPKYRLWHCGNCNRMYLYEIGNDKCKAVYFKED